MHPIVVPQEIVFWSRMVTQNESNIKKIKGQIMLFSFLPVQDTHTGIKHVNSEKNITSFWLPSTHFM